MMFRKRSLLLFVGVMLLLIFASYFFIDRSVAEYFLANIATYETIGDTISIAGESHWYIATGIFGFIFFKYYKKNTLHEQRFLFLLYINLFSGVINLLLKWLFARIRPWGLRDGHDEYGFLLFQNFDMGFLEKMRYHFMTLAESPTTYSSFPSGHTTTIVAVTVYLLLFFPRYKLLWFSLAIILALSRVLANDHFISDIFAGIIVGTLSTLFLYSKMKDKLEKNS
ncbi:MAG: phosphatase PAP2 family protein [Sulfurimonas sp.]|nr:phosphatase PAP2 family protein [Sulfurimonas sp.]MDD5202832.1 phosphatase PAP2 family protein [Sulfurimonas sp.]